MQALLNEIRRLSGRDYYVVFGRDLETGAIASVDRAGRPFIGLDPVSLSRNDLFTTFLHESGHAVGTPPDGTANAVAKELQAANIHGQLVVLLKLPPGALVEGERLYAQSVADPFHGTPRQQVEAFRAGVAQARATGRLQNAPLPATGPKLVDIREAGQQVLEQYRAGAVPGWGDLN